MSRSVAHFCAFIDQLRGWQRNVTKMAIDAVLVSAAYYAAYLIRFDGAVPAGETAQFLRTAPLLLLISLSCFYLFRLYKGVWAYASVKDLLLLLVAHLVACTAFTTSLYIAGFHGMPRSVLVIYYVLGFLALGGVRFTYRVTIETMGLPSGSARRVLVVGAGDTGEMIIRQLKGHRELGYAAVGLVDDDPAKQGISIHGVPVLGTHRDIPDIADRKRIDQIIIATPKAGSTRMREIVKSCEATGLDFRIAPSPREIVDGKVKMNELRRVRIEDLLAREPVQSNFEDIARLLRGKVVMVTGAAGSIGQELVQQVSKYRPDHIILYDRAENNLFYLQHRLNGMASKLRYSFIVGDVTDLGKTRQVIEDHLPDIIFHAAAHKHVPLMETNPEEAIKNNLKGTMNVAQLANRFGVQKFVLISTDKAVEPTSIMGASKRLAEYYVQALAEESRTQFITVRFGNVLGSDGSVVTLFQQQIEKGGPVTVTDPRMTRFFMTISEAVLLILQASSLGEGGEIFVLDMGEPIKIVDMARHLITLSGLEPDKDIPIEYVGKRPGEKLHESLWNGGEEPARTRMSKIFMARTEPLDKTRTMRVLRQIITHAERMERHEMVASVQELIPVYEHYQVETKKQRPRSPQTFVPVAATNYDEREAGVTAEAF